MTKLIITEGEEQVDYEILQTDGTKTHIINVNHDDHGWSGMDATGTALENFARALGVELEYRSGHDETDPDPLGD